MMVSYAVISGLIGLPFPRVAAMLTISANDRQGLLVASVIPGRAAARTRNLEIPGSMLASHGNDDEIFHAGAGSFCYRAEIITGDFDAQIVDRAGGAGDVEPDQLRLQRDPDQ